LQHRYSRSLAHFGELLHKRHYISSTDGNLSVRLDEKHILTTPTGVSKGFMSPRDMVVVDLHGRKICGSSEPSSELGMHLTIYKLRKEQ
jgi:L-fuculose-phosphate aldolase